MNPIYYECHITIEPVLGTNLEKFNSICKSHKFKVAKLLMRKGDSLETSTLDSFCTGHDTSYDTLLGRMTFLLQVLKETGFCIFRYKIESILVDSRNSDILNLVT